MQQFHSIKDVATRLNLSVQTVWRYVQDGRLPAFKFGGSSYRISDEALQYFINAGKIAESVRGHTAAESERN